MRGSDWLYNYFLGFYRDDRRASGWNNLVFPNVAMPHVLWQLSGHEQAGRDRIRGPRKGDRRARSPRKGLAQAGARQGGKWVVLHDRAATRRAR